MNSGKLTHNKGKLKGGIDSRKNWCSGFASKDLRSAEVVKVMKDIIVRSCVKGYICGTPGCILERDIQGDQNQDLRRDQ